jgi:cobalt-zinc-cadmium efflux system outer membrane protein
MYKLFLPLTFVAFLSAPTNAQTLAYGADNPLILTTFRQQGVVEAAGALTLQAALSLTTRANADLASARNEVSAVEAAVLQAGVRPNPSLGLEIQDKRRETRETTLQLNAPIELGGKRAARINAAERGLDAANAEFKAKQAEIRAAVISAFFDVLGAQERTLLAQESVELAKRATNVAAKRVIAGKVLGIAQN